jgi:hypothetical protein
MSTWTAQSKEGKVGGEGGGGYLTVFCEIDFEDFGVVFEAEGGHCEYNVFAIDCFSFLLVAFF